MRFYLIRESINFIRLYGFKFFLTKVKEKLFHGILFYLGRGDSGKEKFNSYLMELIRNKNRYTSSHRTAPVDIIVPVYNAFEYTTKCIESVLKNSIDCRLIIINDASTDGRIKYYLDGLGSISKKNIEVLVLGNKENLGFVKTVNHAYKYTKNHFVLLNTDTEVPPWWLDRLFLPITENEDTVASVTPFSNAATICSFPEFCKDNQMFKNLNVEVIGRYFRIYGSKEMIEIPTGIGFCMAFNRKLVEKIGFFDEVTFEKGYGEENDWCMRAHKKGFKNVMITNLFVYHKHGASYSISEKKKMMDENLKKLLKKHPQYLLEVEKFIRKDPIKDIRDTIAVIIDTHTKGNKKLLVVIDNDLGGGANAYSLHLVNSLMEKGFCILHVKFNFYKKNLKFIYKGDIIEREFIFDVTAAEEIDNIVTVFKPDFILVNELVSWADPINLAEKITKLNMPFVTVLHDYFYICPNWNLINHKKAFCNIPTDIEICSRCLAENTLTDSYVIYGNSFDNILLWRKKMYSFLKKAKHIVCFSESSKEYILKAYPNLSNISIIEHSIIGSDSFVWKKRKFNNSRPLTIGIIGGIGFHKGAKIIKELITHPDYKKLAVNITVIGNTSIWPDGYTSYRKKFRVHGIYKREELPSLLEKYNVSMVLIPSIWPETFSFTTSEALLLGYPVICFNIGASAERIRKYNCGIVVNELSVDALLHAVKDIYDKPEMIEKLSTNTANYVPITEEEYLDRIIALFNTTAN